MPEIGIIVDMISNNGRQVIMGALSYALTQVDLIIRTPATWSFADFGQWKQWHVDGVIAELYSAEMREEVLKLGVPVVSSTGVIENPGVPTVCIDYEACGKMAFEHFHERGFRHLAYVGANSSNSAITQASFEALAQKAGASFVCIKTGASAFGRGDPEHPMIIEWLKKLPRPVGIFALYDGYAAALLECCIEAGVSVPEHAAVLGRGNEELIYRRTRPPLSSIAVDGEAIGYKAAENLIRILKGESVPALVKVPPLSVMTRKSTDILAITDAEIADALRFIRLNAHTNIDVSAVVARFPFSRRVFERRFSAAVGRTPMAEILRVQLALVQRLLIETNLSMPEIAERSGFNDASYMGVVFRKNFGMTPSRYRRQRNTHP